MNSIVSQQCQTASLLAMANATGVLGAECAAAYPGAEAWKCLYGVYRAPFLKTPYLLQASEEDVFQIEARARALSEGRREGACACGARATDGRGGGGGR